MRKYIFIFRAFNDIDHITPIIDHLAQKENYKIYLYSSEHPSRFVKNENLAYLFNTYGLTVKYLVNPNSVITFPYVLDSGMMYMDRMLERYIFGEKVQIVINKLRKILRKSYIYLYQKSKIQYNKIILDRVSPDVIAYDWTSPCAFPYKNLTLEAKRRKIPVIALPHAVVAYTSLDMDGKDFTEHQRKQWKFFYNSECAFDYQVTFSNLGKKILLHKGVKEKDIVVLGSIRFSYDWISKIGKVYDKSLHIQASNGRTKVVIFLSKNLHKGYPENVKQIILSTIESNCYVVLKPQTRGMKVDFLKDIILNFSDQVYVAHNESSCALSRWCDISVVWGSSIGLQVLLDDKNLIYAKLAHDNNTIYDYYLPDTVVSSIDQYILKLNKIINSTTYKTYSANEFDNLYNSVICNNDSIIDIKLRYEFFLLSI